MQLIYASPSNTAITSRVDERGQQFETGTSRIFEWLAPSGPNYVGGLVTPSPARDVYEYRLDTAPAPAYHKLESTSTLFNGVVQDAAAWVDEIRNYVPLTLDELYEVKCNELKDQDNRVRYQTVDTALSASWYLVVTVGMRLELANIAAVLAARTQGIVDSELVNWYPGGANQPRLAIYNAANGRARREQVDEPTYKQLIDELGAHDQATGNATFDCGSAMDAAYADGAGDWATLEAIDPTDGTWGYPPYVELPERIRELFGGQFV